MGDNYHAVTTAKTKKTRRNNNTGSSGEDGEGAKEAQMGGERWRKITLRKMKKDSGMNQILGAMNLLLNKSFGKT
jgi:hypothetical protein